MLPGFYHDVQDGNEFPHARDPGYLRWFAGFFKFVVFLF